MDKHTQFVYIFGMEYKVVNPSKQVAISVTQSQESKTRLSQTKNNPSSPQVHLAMVRYHEAGRFCEKDEQWDQDSAMFHLERAALCGELEAIVALGQCCLQLPHHILPDMVLEVTTLFAQPFLCTVSLQGTVSDRLCSVWLTG